MPVKTRVTITQVGPVTGAIAESATTPGDETLTIPAKLNLGFSSFTLFGVTVSTNCTTTEPLSLALVDNLSQEALESEGWSFSGTTSVPTLRCAVGVLSSLYGEVLNGLVSGPGAAYTLRVSAP